MYFIYFQKFIYLFLETGKGERKKGRESSMCGCLCAPPTGTLAYNPGMFPDWESDHPPLVLQALTQSTELHQPGQEYMLLSENCDSNTNIFSCMCM